MLNSATVPSSEHCFYA